MNRTNLYDRLQKYNSKFVDFNGWEMAISYDGTLKEHSYVRDNAGFFDVSHMGRLYIDNKNIDLLNTLICGNILKKESNSALYTMILNEKGGVIDDVIIWKFNSYSILICNASNTEKVLDWFAKHGLENDYMNESTSLIAIQGPNVINKLSNQFDIPENFECLFTGNPLFKNEITIARTGYTGEDGVEIMINHNDDEKLIDLLDELNIPPCGLGSRDTLRLEASLPLYGQELNENISPVEIGFKWVVDTDHEFYGKDVLLQQMSDGKHKYLKRFVIEERIVGRHGDKVSSGSVNGVVTSGNYSPKLEKSIGFVLFESKPESDSIKLSIRDRLVDGKVIQGRFIGK